MRGLGGQGAPGGQFRARQATLCPLGTRRSPMSAFDAVAFIGCWNVRVVGFQRSWVGMGGLLYFVPLVVMMALVLVVLWLIGRWFGRIDR